MASEPTVAGSPTPDTTSAPRVQTPGYGNRRVPRRKRKFENKWLARGIAAAMVVVTFLYLAATAVTWTTSTSGYAGVPLNGTPQDVLYSIGSPDLARGSASEPWRPVNGATTLPLWYYRSPGVTVRFDEPGGSVTEIYCENVENLAGSCPGALGLNIGDSEQEVFELFGTPREGVIAGGRKSMSYDEAGYEFSLARLRVRGVRFRAPSGTPSEKFARYLTWLIP